MRLPKNTDNWSPRHADQALDLAWRAFQRYEARIDFALPQCQQDRIYEPYRRARADAVLVAEYLHWRHREARMLP